MRHAFGVLGVLAASVLLLVSGAMNWRFGYSLGHSELDSQLLGLASAAADGLKALIPFFLFAALRNKQWSQALAASLLWVICITYSFTSALGFSALNRADTAGSRMVQASAYQDVRSELDQARERLGWVPQHRPALTVSSEIEQMKQDRRWKGTENCTNATKGNSISFCKTYHQLGAELAAANEAEKLQKRIDELRGSIQNAATAVAVVSADPQTEVLSGLSGQSQEVVKMALTVLIAVLVELGSSLGYFVVFSAWKTADVRSTPANPVVSGTVVAKSRPVAAPVAPAAAITANDNRQAPKLVAPESDVERFYKERITTSEGSSLTATSLYEDYSDWCDEHGKEPMALPTFGRAFGDLGVHKAKIAGRIRYIGIKLNSETLDEEDQTPSSTTALTTQSASGALAA